MGVDIEAKGLLKQTRQEALPLQQYKTALQTTFESLPTKIGFGL